jgi:phospholipase C
MKLKKVVERGLDCVRLALTGIALFQFSIGIPVVNAQQEANNSSKTASPIKHVIVIIGENRSFDHVFATYVPKNGQTVNNLLSEGIVNADGTPGKNFNKAQQLFANDTAQDQFLLSPYKEQYPGNIMPTPLAGGPKGAQGYFSGTSPCPNQPSLNAVQCAQISENGLPYSYYSSLASGGTGITSKTPDTRIANVTNLQAGPFQLSPGAPSNTYSASPVHRFYQMWQQENCSLEHATWDNPSGCNAKLFSYVEVTVGAGTNGEAQAPLCSPGDATTCFSYNYLPNTPGQKTTGEGSTSLGFYNVQQGDAPYFKSLADKYAMSDNFHQSVDGGTGANHIMFGHGDAIWFSDGYGHPAVPPNGTPVFTEPYQGGPNPSAGTVNEVENANAQAGTNNWWVEDGYGNANNAGYPPPFSVSPASGGGSYSDCSDTTQAGVGQIVAYLKSLHIDPRCQPGHYYLLNNYNPGYFGQGENAYADQNPSNTPFTIPPSSTPSIGDVLLAHNVSWKYYGDQWNNYAGNAKLNIPEDKYQLNYGTNGPNADEYCNICNPFQYDTSIMANAAIRNAHIQDTLNLYDDIKCGNLPAVSIVKPSGYVDGHPASSKLDMFEGFTKKIVDQVLASPYAKDTAIFITEDEGGGYYDSGYVQPLDFFGDGTRIIFLVVAPYLKSPGLISHEYTDHVSILKFIERNWNLPTVTNRSRDNFPNPISSANNPYVPQNTPAIGDLFDFFDFGGNWSGGGQQ